MEQLVLNEIIIKSDRICIEDSVIWISSILPDIPSMVDSNKNEI